MFGTMRIIKKMAVVLIVAGLLALVQANPDGAPPESCQSMEVQHGAEAQNTLAPFQVIPLKNETMTSEKVVVRLETKKNANDKFKGFLVMAFDAVNDAEPIGRFDDPISNDNAKIVQCPAPFTLNIGVTHTKSNAKDSVEVTWTPPEGFVGAVVFKTTFVKDTNTFWLKETSSIVVVKPDAVPTSSTTARTTTTTNRATTTTMTTTPRRSTTTTTPTTPRSTTTKLTTTPVPRPSGADGLINGSFCWPIILFGSILLMMIQ